MRERNPKTFSKVLQGYGGEDWICRNCEKYETCKHKNSERGDENLKPKILLWNQYIMSWAYININNPNQYPNAGGWDSQPSVFMEYLNLAIETIMSVREKITKESK